MGEMISPSLYFGEFEGLTVFEVSLINQIMISFGLRFGTCWQTMNSCPAILIHFSFSVKSLLFIVITSDVPSFKSSILMLEEAANSFK